LTREQYAQDKNRASYYWEARKGGLIVACEYSPNGTENPLSTIPPAPYQIHAIAYRPTDFACYFWDIEPGMTPIWLHHVSRWIGPTGMSDEYESLLFGRRYQDGREELILVLWDGTAHGFNSINDAIAALTV
jgi:hypothetical protein